LSKQFGQRLEIVAGGAFLSVDVIKINATQVSKYILASIGLVFGVSKQLDRHDAFLFKIGHKVFSVDRCKNYRVAKQILPPQFSA